jgi:hypothetical protein
MASQSIISVFDDSVSYEELKERIKNLAYYKWQESGCPTGQDKNFWIEAENEVIGQHNVRDGGYYVYVKGRHNTIRLSFLSPVYNTCYK